MKKCIKVTCIKSAAKTFAKHHFKYITIGANEGN